MRKAQHDVAEVPSTVSRVAMYTFIVDLLNNSKCWLAMNTVLLMQVDAYFWCWLETFLFLLSQPIKNLKSADVRRENTIFTNVVAALASPLTREMIAGLKYRSDSTYYGVCLIDA